MKLSKKPRYWDSWKGRILRAIILDNATTWKDVKNRSGLEQRKMFKVVRELDKAGVLEYSKDSGFRIMDEDLSRAYETTAGEKVPESKEPSHVHIDWLQSWIENNEACDATLDHLHFFLDGINLSEFTRKLFGQAKKSIYVVNPFVDKAGLGTALRDAAKGGIEVSLITRRPRDKPTRWGFHKTLVKENVALYYSGFEDTGGGVHSKLIIVDDEIAIVSSMNFTAHSENANYETGIVTIDKAVVESAKESIIGIRDEHETESALTMHQR